MVRYDVDDDIDDVDISFNSSRCCYVPFIHVPLMYVDFFNGSRFIDMEMMHEWLFKDKEPYSTR